MKQFCDTAEQAVKEAVGQINQDLRSLRKITDDVGIVTDNIGTFSGSIRDVGEGIGQLARNVREVGDLIQDLKIETAASMYGLRAGLKTGFEVFLKSLFRVGSAR
jgi:methyl-accepting chemotaxis protein